ncbi:hypothetical protein B484DRAFT_402954 [Ochromonadaceae sp. CCMP2298]|nr:hypothetical protein B484DRAFT_402954 [Ochromonadaceae sp. CCMP2298]
MTPWKNAEWENTAAAKLAVADLADFLNGDRSSVFEDPKPMFSWEFAIEKRPGVAEKDLEVHLFLAKTEEAYFAHREEFRKDRQQWDKDKEFLRGEVTKALAILLPTISAKVLLQFRKVINTRDIAVFTDHAIGAKEEMQDFLARAERTADGFGAYGAKALMHDTQALAATSAGQALINKARDDERKKIGGGKADSKQDGRFKAGRRAAVAEEDEVSGDAQVSEVEAAVKRQVLCFECGLRGHIAAVCPWAENFKKLRADCKAKQGDKATDKATPAAEEINCWMAEPEHTEGTHEAEDEAAFADVDTGAAEEPIEDCGGRTLPGGAAPIEETETHIEEAGTTADVAADSAPSPKAVATHRSLSTLNRYAALAISSSDSDSDSGSNGEGPLEVSSGSDGESSSDGEDSTSSSSDCDANHDTGGALQPSETEAHDFETWLAGAQGATPLELLHRCSEHPSEMLAHGDSSVGRTMCLPCDDHP